MAGKKQFKIQTPRGQIVNVKGKNGSVHAKLEWNSGFGPEESEKFSRKQVFVDNECLRHMAPETPRRTGMLIKSATLFTVAGSGLIKQKTPYARRQYYTHRTKSKWFERMKNRHKDAILRGAEKIE